MKVSRTGAKDSLSFLRTENKTMVMNLRFSLSAEGIKRESRMVSFTCLKDDSGCFMING